MNFTSRLGLNKPDPDPVTGDVVDVSKLNENADKIDSTISFTVCTSAARPAVPFQGQAILETDTGKAYVWGGSAWLPLLIGAKAQVETSIGIGAAPDANSLRKLSVFSAGVNGSLSQVLLRQTGTAASSRALSTMGGGDTQDHWFMDFDGKMQWGSGTASADVTLGRSGAGTLDLSTGSLVSGGVPVGTPADIQKFFASGTWSMPSRARRVKVMLVGGGGAGAGSIAPTGGAGFHSKGGGGGGGGYCEKWFDAADLTSSVAVTIGAGGTGAVGPSNGAAGGTTSFGTFLSASGGSGGFHGGNSNATYAKNGGPGGNTFTGSPDLQVAGCFGLQGHGGAGLGSGGPGGASYWGGGGAGAENTSSTNGVAGGAGQGWGGGGGGAATAASGAAASGGSGKAGYMIVETYF